MTGFSNIAQRRAVLGGLTGLAVFGVDAVATLIRFVLNPSVAERTTAGSLLAMFLFLILFIAGGALAGYLWSINVQLLRFLAIGALVGALIWSYFTLTWPLTARASALVAPHTSVLNAALIGAGLGALGGTLLFAIGLLLRLIHRHR
jgi:hypothetical protein